MQTETQSTVLSSEEQTQQQRPHVNILSILVVVALILGAAVGGYSFAKYTIQDQSYLPAKPNNQIDLDTSTKPQVSENTVSLSMLGVSVLLPQPFTQQITELKEQVAESGKQACSTVHEDESGELKICATSRHFTSGRGERFVDAHGYLESPTGYYILFPFHESEAGKPEANKIVSDTSVEILKIYGQNKKTEFGVVPVSGTPGEGYIGAIINTGNPDYYDGLTLQMKLDDTYTEAVFDEILKSIVLN